MVRKLDPARLPVTRPFNPRHQRIAIAFVADALRKVVLEVFEDHFAIGDTLRQKDR